MRKITTANESERLNLPRNRARQGDASCWSHHWTRRVGVEGALVASQPRRACPGGLRTARPATATCPAARPCPGSQKASWPDLAQPCPGVGRADLPAPAASPDGGALPGTTSSPAASPGWRGQPRRQCYARLAFFPDIYGKEPWRVGGLELGRSTERSWREMGKTVNCDAQL
ncbi:unnamed protein product [Miscanthus lutarioriparius]|uniref:Uncharacterized protein n=1 Tax=Miscanthus lutarioriparius TaxID=422564 RepID=A0A811Q7K3_9POAL|nr:unnamed protein product [Miscanthus lutarioriparius]